MKKKEGVLGGTGRVTPARNSCKSEMRELIECIEKIGGQIVEKLDIICKEVSPDYKKDILNAIEEAGGEVPEVDENLGSVFDILCEMGKIKTCLEEFVDLWKKNRR